MMASGLWWWRRPDTGLAFTGHSILALKTGAVETRTLPDGLVDVSPTAPNIRSVRELAELAEDALGALGARRERVALALPDLAITTKVFRGRGRQPERELRRELGPSLPYAVSEARCDFWRGRHGEVLAAAVREPVVRQYEQIVEALECGLAWVDGVSLATIPLHPAGRGLDVDVQLYRGHYTLTVFHDGELVDVRTKLRSGGAVSLVCREVLRVPALHESEAIESVRVLGENASAVADELARSERARDVRVDNEGEQRQLQVSLETLFARGNP